MKKTKKYLLLSLLLLIVILCMAIAACKETTAELRFDTMGGDEIQAVTLDVGIEYTLPTPVRDGYSFEGWYTSKDYSGESVAAITVEKSTVFYAKWKKLPVITLELGSGARLEGVSGSLYLKAGENIYSFMESFIPTREGFEFDKWYVGTSALLSTATMPTEGITLVAHYKVGYTVETYLQTINLDGYERGEDVKGFAPTGESYSPGVTMHGFYSVKNDNAVTRLVLSENPSENVYKFYFDREEYSVTLRSNYPNSAGKQEETQTFNKLYGDEFELADDAFSAKGHCLVGWSTSANGEVEYNASYIANHLYKGQSAEPVTLDVDKDIVLYAVWNNGSADVFGGTDFIYVIEEEHAAYLERGGVFFKGEYNANRGTFDFRDVRLSGRLNDGGTFVYYDEDRASGSAMLYVMGTGVKETTTIHFDEYDAITYSEENGFGPSSQSKGTYFLDENGYYVATFNSGELNGKTFSFIVDYVTHNGVSSKVFQIRNEEDYNLGRIPLFVFDDGQLSYFEALYTLILNGFGMASIYGDDGWEHYLYIKEDDIIELYDSTYSPAYTFKLVTFDDHTGYMFYDADYDETFTSQSGATLCLDGAYIATYTDGETVIEGYYSTYTSVFGDIVGFVPANATNTIRIFVVTSTSETTHTFIERGENYSEFYFGDAQGVYEAPFVVLDETTDGEMTIYGLTTSGEYVKIADGSYVLDNVSQHYIATIANCYDEDVYEMSIDFTNIQTFVFDVTSVAMQNNYGGVSYYPVIYCISITTDEGTTEFETVYAEQDGEATLTVVASVATYTKGTITVSGTCSLNEGILILSTTYNGNAAYLYFEIDEQNKTFLLLTDMMGSVYAMLPDGNVNENESLWFDGKGGVVYSITDDEENVTEYNGIYEETADTTVFGETIYLFTAEEISFRFIIVYTDAGNTWFARYNNDVNGVYQNGTAQLQLDGFGYTAVYTVDGKEFEGIYYITDDGAVCLIFDNSNRVYIDLDGRNFTVRGLEYGGYFLVDNLNYGDIYLVLNGYGSLTAYINENNDVTELEGTYTINNDGTIELCYQDEGTQWKYVASVGTIVVSSNYRAALYVLHEEVIRSYVDETDWSVLVLDGYNNATKTNAYGQTEEGQYLLVTENLFYYVNNNGTDGGLYAYDNTKHIANALNFAQVSYYTENLESLLFTNYGYMLMEGASYYYYNIVDGKVYVYHTAEDGEDSNKYGFVEEQFGTFENVKTWHNKTYHYNSGYALVFNRAEEGTKPYPVLIQEKNEKFDLEELRFMPSGTAAEFTVKGTVMIDGTSYDCTVTRAFDKDGNVEMYIMLQNYRFDIDVNYLGDQSNGISANTYSITAMRFEFKLYSAMYLLWNDFYNSAFGVSIENSFGVITMIDEFDENGDPIEDGSYINATFGALSGLTDLNGTLIGKLENSAYTLTGDGLYCVEVQGADGNTYRIYFAISDEFEESYGVYSYEIYAYVCVETLPLEDDYTVEIERVIFSESEDFSLGDLFSAQLYLNGEEIDADLTYMQDNLLYYVVKGEEDSIAYYLIAFEEDIPEDEEGEQQNKTIYLYKSASMTTKQATRYVSDELNYADFDIDDDVIMIVFENNVYIAQTTETGEDGYTVTSDSGVKFHVTKSGVIEKINED